MNQHRRRRGDFSANCPQCGKAYPGWPICNGDGYPLDRSIWPRYGTKYRKGIHRKVARFTRMRILLCIITTLVKGPELVGRMEVPRTSHS